MRTNSTSNSSIDERRDVYGLKKQRTSLGRRPDPNAGEDSISVNEGNVTDIAKVPVMMTTQMLMPSQSQRQQQQLERLPALQ
jgi:fumarylacetoacetate (FAA) hydrolase family protein